MTYYYRVDPEKRINGIKDGVLRACDWQQGSFPHKNLAIISAENPNQRVYRVCFYDNETVARNHLTEFSSEIHINYGNGVQILTRWPHAAPSTAGFTWSEDDGFAPGKASLYWVLEQSNDKLSSIGINLSLAEVWDDEQELWVQLLENYPHLNPEFCALASKSLLTETVANSVSESAMDHSKSSNGRLKRCMEWLLGKLSGK